jgi:hypothetical protein
MTNDYQREQRETLQRVRSYLRRMPSSETHILRQVISDYLGFRREVDDFLNSNFSRICTSSCFQRRRSACCSREGIITFFADVLVNALCSEEAELDALHSLLREPNRGLKCIYLGPVGCRWKIKPIVCVMFLCDSAKAEVFGNRPRAEQEWNELELARRQFTWPDRPVLFDDLEAAFIEAGFNSPLTYYHNSPGLLRLKKRAGLTQA